MCLNVYLSKLNVNFQPVADFWLRKGQQVRARFEFENISAVNIFTQLVAGGAKNGFVTFIFFLAVFFSS